MTRKIREKLFYLEAWAANGKKCSFCDYHLDSSLNEQENFEINKNQMDKVTGIYKHLEVINSGSFTELDSKTMESLRTLCKEKQILTLHFECHWLYRNQIPKLRESFAEVGTTLKIKTGVETFDYEFREKFLNKGIMEENPQKIAEQFDECCLLFGLSGQTKESMINDINVGLANFERVCVNIFVKNSTKILPDENVIRVFVQEVMPLYKNNDKVDILLNNTDFGVGEQ